MHTKVPARSAFDRRSFLRSVACASVAGALTDPLQLLAAAGEPRVGIQLFTLQNPLARDFAGTLATLKQIGYQSAEVLGLLGHSPRAYRNALDAAGLTAPSMHIVSREAESLFTGMAAGTIPAGEAWTKIVATMDPARIETIMHKMFVEAETLGSRYLVMAALSGDLFTTRAGVDRVLAAYIKAGDMCHERGLVFAMHPHLAEFTRIDGISAFEYILARTDPKKVFIELDFFWAATAHADIPALLRKYRGRFRLGHVKDLTRGVVVPPNGFANLDAVKPEYFEDVGYGQLDFATWIPLAREAGMREFFLERDISPDALASAKRSFPALKSLLTQA
jgi:sugar phosphate isomerase/epimerase